MLTITATQVLRSQIPLYCRSALTLVLFFPVQNRSGSGLPIRSEKKIHFSPDREGTQMPGSKGQSPQLPSFSPKCKKSFFYSSHCTYIIISLISSMCFSIVITTTLSPTSIQSSPLGRMICARSFRGIPVYSVADFIINSKASTLSSTS